MKQRELICFRKQEQRKQKQFIQGSVYTGFWFVEGLFYTEFKFIQGLVYTGFWFIEGSV
jgi:hypothetical protein